ncbi:hypothetical protein COY90_00100 [Candidatus Roizmanbacteria bacterium CG_4_10_14_0_8_um_filter_39_9]|uniref:Aminoglycoside phosphotransferase domain-containing protein n=1 Tax=Candidatus Roizmanbacteria bacterium CG_4_10_14_0_8_um_filter_39_9 TaxID=1974829 RepID=A0A2M7QEA1_9BACT|nr:MAG: hypothetical protein COY90_00100 [Candidatus Roizmanbacteria bacterium CG_4_10_14_0_8_um_filter_39_9]
MNKYHATGGGANRSVAEVERLKKKYDVFDVRLIHNIFKEILGLTVSGIKKPLNIGLPHVTYVVSLHNYKDLVFRANLGTDEPEIQLLKEKVIADVALQKGVPSNKILYVDISRKKYPFDFQIQEKFNGLDAEIEFKGTKEDYDTYSFNIGRLIAHFSDIEFSGYGHFADEMISQNKLVGENNSFYDYICLELHEQIDKIIRGKFISSETGKNILRLFKTHKDIINIEKSNLVHYDLADHNLRYDPKSNKVVAVYDWEAAVSGDSCLDLASSPTWKTLYPRQDKLIEGYLSLKEKPDHFQEKLNIYRLRTIIWKIVQNMKFNLINPQRMKRLQTALDPYHLKMTS